MNSIMVSGSFDDLRSPQMRILDEASRLGELQVGLWSDELIERREGKTPKFPLEERRYLLGAIRYITKVHVLDESQALEVIPGLKLLKPQVYVTGWENDRAEFRQICMELDIQYHVLSEDGLGGFPELDQGAETAASGGKKALVTGCFDWFHSGHVRFFEEVSALGDLYVIVGHDENLRLLKGEGHPLFPQDERRYMVQSVRYVKEAIISTGHGWMDAEPEIERLQPDMYVVNEDGDKPEKRAFCESRQLEYVVLKRKPKEGLPRRQSTDLRGF